MCLVCLLLMLASIEPAALESRDLPAAHTLVTLATHIKHTQVHGFVGFTHHKLPNGLFRLGWVRAPWRAGVRAAVLGPAAGGGRIPLPAGGGGGGGN